MDPSENKFTIKSLNFCHQFKLAIGRLDARRHDRSRTELLVEHDLDIRSAPHRKMIPA
jgi:hypothetical protein